MTEEEKQKLNEKLARWAGFTEVRDAHTNAVHADRLLTPKDTYWEGRIWVWVNKLNFIDSLDACFEWLVPKYIAEDTSRDTPNHIANAYRRLFERWLKKLIMLGWDKPDLALCLTIENLIDNE